MSGLRAIRRGGVYYAAGTVAGQRVRQSLGTRDAATAQELCAHLEARLWKRRTYGDEAIRTFEEAALSYMEAGGDRRFLPPLIRRFHGRVLATIKPGDVKDAARAIYPAGKGSTRNRQAVTPARAVINHAAQLGWCAPITVDPFPSGRPRRVTVDRTWIDIFLARADADGLPHLSAAVLFMWTTGTRVGETARVLPEHIDLGRRIVALPRTKTGTWEVRHLTTEMVVRLGNLPLKAGKPIFGYAGRHGIYQRMEAVCDRAGLTFVPPHQAGRHSYATRALAMGAPLKAVMEGGGWKTARMLLEIYAHAEDGGRAVADLFDGENGTISAQPVVKGAKNG